MSVVSLLNHVIGQQRAVTVLKTALDAYWNDRCKTPKPFPHVLITGPGGLGKTFISEIIAKELCTKVHVELAQNIRNIGQMQGMLMMLEEDHLLVVDEIHQLSDPVQVCLYRALEEGLLFLGGNKKPIKLPRFTLVGATTHEHCLNTSCLDRFQILLRLTHYAQFEMAQLLAQRAMALGWQIDESSLYELAKRSRGVPRLGVRLLDAAKRVASANDCDDILPVHVHQMLEMQEIDELGFDAVEQRYLLLLHEYQAPVRLNVLANQLGLPKQSIEMFEADFFRMGLIYKDEKGRRLTPLGIDHVRSLPVRIN